MNYDANPLNLPKLTLTQVEQLLGDKAANMVLYAFYDNIEGLAPGWNRTEYNGQAMQDLGEATIHANKLKSLMSSHGLIRTGNALALIAIKTVSRRDFRNKGRFTQNPTYSGLGFIMTNFIVFNKETGTYRTNPNGWYGTGVYPVAAHAAQRGVVNSMFYLSNSAWACNEMMAAYQKQK